MVDARNKFNELIRVTRGFIVLVEPIYETASDDQKKEWKIWLYYIS